MSARVMRIVVYIVVAVSLFSGFFAGYEAIRLGPLATPERIADYHFGSESMLAHGGAAYTSRAHYVASTAVFALLSVFSAVAGVGYLRRNAMGLGIASLAAFGGTIAFGVLT